MTDFKQKYTRLNASQKKAVDTIHGPVMVIAGPGTGKTELLSMRVANILQKTDSLPQNILCLTFTESGARAMRERLVSLIGKDAYHVAIHTFHSFGSEVINTYREFFHQGAIFSPAHELTTHQILEKILRTLPHDSTLSSQMNGEFTQISQIQHSISDFKRSGLTPDEIQSIITHNMSFIEYMEPALRDFFGVKIHKSMLATLPKLLEHANAHQTPSHAIAGIPQYPELFIEELEHLIANTDSTKPLTAWRNKWLEKNEHGELVFKDRKRQKKLLEASHVYWEYINAMQQAEVYDYDDMIVRVVHAFEIFPELRHQLQETYQYILVDEFQDTNGAQLRIVLSLIDNPVHEGKPNILVVGDDDQAIYSFQGAEISNIMTLQKHLREPIMIPLVDNYRSHADILEKARMVITQGTDRLENTVPNLDKTPIAHATPKAPDVSLHEAQDPTQEYSWIAQSISAHIKAGVTPESIAIIARNHRDLHTLLPYLQEAEVPFEYEYRDNILEEAPVTTLLLLARIVHNMAEGDIHAASTLLPEFLSHPMWKLDAHTIWQVSLAAHKAHITWFEAMQQSETVQIQHIAQWLIELTPLSLHSTLDATLDFYIGNEPTPCGSDTFTSPLKEYYFSDEALTRDSELFVRYLTALRYLRSAVKDYLHGKDPSINDMLTFTSLSQSARISLSVPRSTFTHTSHSVQVMTAHKSKGLEFNTVYIINATDERWGSKSRSYSSRLGYPANLAIAPAGESDDEKLRLFFVAMTRAKEQLHISYSATDHAHAHTLKAHFLEANEWTPQPLDTSPLTVAAARSLSWHHTISQHHTSLKDTLQPLLDSYRLSATHLNAFIDVTQGGPQYFLMQNLLHFPKAIPPAAALGSAVHHTLKLAHDHYAAHHKKRPVEDLLYDFEAQLKAQHLAKDDFTAQLEKGTGHLSVFLPHFLETLDERDKAERDFRTQQVTLGDTRLTGIIDSLHIDVTSKTIIVRDYKTGSPSRSWQGKSDYEKIKLHKYTQQLLFYKLLIEHSRDFAGYTVTSGEIVFIQPDGAGTLHRLAYTYPEEEVNNFTLLLHAVWRHITYASFIDTDSYTKNYNGILAFEKYLRDE